MANDAGVVVVGGGLAGAKSVEALRDLGYEGRVVLYGGERHLPYERPALSKGYLKGSERFEDAVVHDEQWYADHAVEVHLGTRVVALDRQAHEVVLEGGARAPYGTVLLATGSSPRRLDVPGADLGGVLSLRTVEDSDALRAALGPGRRVVLVGGGWIGLEVAAAAREAGAEVTVLEGLDVPLGRVLGPRIASLFVDLHREHGVDLRTRVVVEELEGRGGTVTGVRLGDGSVVPADTVVVGIGVSPNTQLADQAGLPVGDGVLADEVGRTEDPDVYAVGDVASAQHPFYGRRIRVEHWANALNQPRVVVAGLLGLDGPEPELPYFYTDQYDLGMEYHGLGGPEDHVVVRGDLGARELIAFWQRDGVVTAAMNVNTWDVDGPLKALIRSRRVVDPQRLADPGVPLEELA